MTTFLFTRALGFYPRAQTNAEALTGAVGKKRRRQNCSRDWQKVPASANSLAKETVARFRKILGAGLATTLRQNQLLFTRTSVFFARVGKTNFLSAFAAKWEIILPASIFCLLSSWVIGCTKRPYYEACRMEHPPCEGAAQLSHDCFQEHATAFVYPWYQCRPQPTANEDWSACYHWFRPSASSILWQLASCAPLVFSAQPASPSSHFSS